MTNGKLLPKHSSLIPYLAEITLSIDSINPAINAKLGRGTEHFDNLEKMATFIEDSKVHQWRIFRFCPLRGTAIKNRASFEVTEEQFRKDDSEKLMCNVHQEIRWIPISQLLNYDWCEAEKIIAAQINFLYHTGRSNELSL